MTTAVVTLRFPFPNEPKIVTVDLPEDLVRAYDQLQYISTDIYARFNGLHWSHWTWDGNLPDGKQNLPRPKAPPITMKSGTTERSIKRRTAWLEGI